MKDPRAVTSNDLSERRLVFRACETRQFEVDRKSTRLNSSHDQISYAVFCLKYPPTPEIYTLSLHDALPICALQSSLVARTLSKKFPARLLRPNYARERIGTQHERPAGCNVERSQRTQTRLPRVRDAPVRGRSEEHTSELQSRSDLVCRLLLEVSPDTRDLHSFPTRRSSDLRPSKLFSCANAFKKVSCAASSAKLRSRKNRYAT